MAQTAFSAGGRRAANWSELKPEYDVPYIPTLPLDHGWEASQAMTSARSVCSSGGYSSVAIPSEDPVPRTSTRATAKPPSSARRRYSPR